MTTLDELKEQVEDLRHVVRMADSDSVETKQLLRAQTRLMMALQGQMDLTIEQKNIDVMLGHQADALASMLLCLTSMQDRMEQRQERMDRNVAAIMRRLGVEPHEES